MFQTKYFRPQDLQYSYFTTIKNDDSKLDGEPDNNRFNRTEAWEMLYMVNKILEISDFEKTKTSARKVERLLRSELPGKERSQLNAMDWVLNNFSLFKF